MLIRVTLSRGKNVTVNNCRNHFQQRQEQI